MNLDQKVTEFLGRAETKLAPSKLEPYSNLIRTLRQRRWTYVQIAQTLRDEFGLAVHPTTIHAFVKVRARKKGVLAMSTPELPPMPPQIAPASSGGAKRPRFHLDA